MKVTGFPLWLLFGASFSLMALGPRPGVPAVFGGAWTFLLAVAAVLTWRRTGLKLAATAMALGAVGMVLLTRILMRTDDLFAAPPGELAAFLAAVLLGPGLLFAQSRTQPARWARWKERSEGCTAADMLLFRHIPDLRGEEPAPPTS